MTDRSISDMLMEEALEIILCIDREGNILCANRTAGEELGYGEELREKAVSAIIKKDFEEEGADWKSVSASLENTGKAVFYRKNGTCFHVALHIVGDAEKERDMLFALNIESGKEMEHEMMRVKEQAQQAMAVRNEFVANVTHELRTPVNGIKGHVDNLKETCLTSEQRRMLNIIEHCCSSMSTIINDILDFSKLESGKMELEKREFSFRKMIDYVAATNMTAINEKGLRFNINVDENIPEYLIGDELRLSQILNNLISNAVKFTSVGFIRVEVTKTIQFNDEIELFFMVVDSGIGISPEDQDKLFKSFSQVDTSITRKYGGTGLGLSIAKNLVELMRGSVYLQSSKGKGSSFSFSVRLNTMERKPELEEFKKDIYQFLEQSENVEELIEVEEYYRFGSEENKKEIEGRMEKLVLCIELGAWEKAELWSEELKGLVVNADTGLKRAVLRLEMNVRKEDHDKSMKQYQMVKTLLEKAWEIK